MWVICMIFKCRYIVGIRGILLIKEGLPKRLKLVYGWHSVALQEMHETSSNNIHSMSKRNTQAYKD